MNVSIKEITAICLLGCGVTMAFIALFLPPPGEIHDSVLYIFAQILIYAGSIFGIGAYIDKQSPPTQKPPNPKSPPTPQGGAFNTNN